MTLKPRSQVDLSFGDGYTINNWTRISMRSSFTDPLDDIELEVRPAPKQREIFDTRLQKGESVDIKIDGVKQGTFLIQTIAVRIDMDGITYSLSLNSPLVTPGQASVDPSIAKHYASDSPVRTVVLEALAPFGFTQLEGDDTSYRKSITGKTINGGASPITVDSLKHADAQAQHNERAYDFCQRFFRRFGAALRINGEGRLLLSAPDYDQAALYTLVQDFDGSVTGNRMLSPITITDTNEDQYSECTVIGAAPDPESNTFAATPKVTVRASDVNSDRPAYKSGAALYKPLILRDKHSRDAERCKSVAKLALGLRAARAFVVRCEVDGFRSREGALYQPNTIAHVTIKARSIDEDMWILSRSFNQSRDGGQTTGLELLPKGALVLGDLPSS